jgi:hypothetical protein
MNTEPPAVQLPKHPLHALTSYELRYYRRDLEHAIKTIAPDAPVQAELRRKLDAVTAEQEDRTNLAAHA